MNKKYLLITLCNLLLAHIIYAQTWNGNAGTDWNTAANWTPATVPTLISNVTIPNTVNKPVFSGNVSITSITTAPGSGINFNGFTLTVSGNFDMNGATLNNTNAATDIAITLNGNSTNYFRQNTINDNLIINYNSTSPLYEAYQYPNIYNQNATFNIGGSGTVYICYDNLSTFNGNVSVNRTVAGQTFIFDNGAVNVGGNFSYTNNAGGNTSIHATGSAAIPIGGTINITAGGAGNPIFLMRKIKNQTTGGTISVQNSGLVTIANDTLRLSAFNINGFISAGTDDFLQNAITGTINISDAAGNTGSNYFRGNLITGNTTIGLNSVSVFYEAYQYPDTFNGNATFNIGGTGTFYTCYDNLSTFNGNVTINRTAAGATFIFDNGAVNVTGNFAYTNNAGGNSSIHATGSVAIPISGTINIAATGTGNPTFLLRKVKNQTTGGTISVQNSGLVTIANDTLLLTAFNVNGINSPGIDDFLQNSITGTINISDAPGNTGSNYFRGNLITGNTTIGLNSISIFYEAYQYPDTYNGNTTFNISGTGTFYTCYDNLSTFNGNVTINRTVAGSTFIFDNGAVAVTGNFSYSNNAGGNTSIHATGSAVTPINGTINITATGTGNPIFLMKKIKNQITGGTISVQNSGLVTIANDTLVINSFNVTGINSPGTDDFLQNSITGNADISDVAANNGGWYFRGNILNGNTSLTQNSTGILYEAYQYSNIYNGNLNLNRNAGTLLFTYDHSSTINQNLTLNAAAGITFSDTVKFGGAINTLIEQFGTQPISIPLLEIKKNGSAAVTLNDSVTITTKATFTSGNINTSATNKLVFADNATHSGSSIASHVIGPVIKIGDDIFTFPVGGPASLNDIKISAPVGVTSRFSAEYKNQNPTIDGYNTNAKAGSLGAAIVSNAGYWDVQRLGGTTNVTLTAGFYANPYQQYPVLANLKVVHWNGSQWDDHGNGGTTGTPAAGTVVNSVPITGFSPFALAGVTPAYFFSFSQPGAGPDGTPLKLKGIGGWPSYAVKLLPAGTYTNDSIFLVPNGSTNSFRLKDLYGVEKDTSITAPVAPTVYISANGNGSINFTGWRHYVYVKNAGNQIIGAIRDNDFTLGNTAITAYFSTPNVATAPNGNIFLKRSFKITSQFAPVGTKRVRLYISKTEFSNLQAADPASFPNGINSLTITKYTGPQEDSLFNPIPGGNAIIIPNSDISIVDLGPMYSLDIDVAGFSGFYIGGNQSNINICSGTTISLPANISGATYQWQIDNGSGYTNIANNVVYSGATTQTLTLTNAPGNIYGSKVRCVVNGNTFSQVYIIRFTALWQGGISNVWENAANWSCGIVPDANTDVVLNAGKPNFPQVGSNASVRSLRVNAGATLTVKTGFTLTVTK